MANEIERIVEAIQVAGRAVYPRELIEQMTNDRRQRRLLQRALQVAFDKGVVKLNKDMKLVSDAAQTRKAA